MEARQIKQEIEVTTSPEHQVEKICDGEAVRELSALELSLIGGGQGSCTFV